MVYAIKTATRIQAWELGAGSNMEEEMLRKKKIIKHPDGTFELFSLEATEGKGQIARPGDFFKVDNRGFPCPNERAFFLQNHQHLEDDWYLQTAHPLKIWRLDDPECEEIHFLQDNGFLRICPENPQRCFSAFIWGTIETAPADAIIIFYDVVRNPEGIITSIDFNFVNSSYFDTHYQVLLS